MKPLYVGNYNYKGEIHTFYRHAVSRVQAKEFMIEALADKLNINPTALRRFFFGQQDNFSVKEHKKGEGI